MKRITIERYDAAKHDTPDGGWPYAGLIEGETDEGEHWIMWIDSHGRPEVFYSSRDETGAVRGQPVFVWRDYDRKDWGTKEHPMTWQEAHSSPGVDGQSG